MEENEDYVRKALLKNFGEEMGKKMYDRHLQTQRHLRKGDNVIHLSFEAPAFNDEDVAEINESFAQHKYQFSYIDESQVAKANFDYQDIIANISINQKIYEMLANALVYPAIWELLKFLSARIIRAKEKFKRKVKKDKICYSISIKEKKTIFLLLDDSVNEENVSSVLDKALEFTKKEKKSDEFNNDRPNSFYYSIDKDGNVKFLE